MPDLKLSEREQRLLRTLIGTEPVPGSPMPERHVLAMVAELVPCDTICAVLMDPEAGPQAFVELPHGYSEYDDAAAGETYYVGMIHWSHHRRAAEECRTLVGLADAVAVGFRNGPTAVAQIALGREAAMFSDRDLAVLELLWPVFQRHLRTELTTTLPAALTVAERRVLNLVSAGMTNGQVAECLFVAPSTVRKHLENSYRKLGVTNRLAAVTVLRGAPVAEPRAFERVESAG